MVDVDGEETTLLIGSKSIDGEVVIGHEPDRAD